MFVINLYLQLEQEKILLVYATHLMWTLQTDTRQRLQNIQRKLKKEVIDIKSRNT